MQRLNPIQQINHITKQLGEKIIRCVALNQHQEALIIWKALLRAATKHFFPSHALTYFLFKLTQKVLFILDQASIDEMLQLLNDQYVYIVETQFINEIVSLQSQLKNIKSVIKISDDNSFDELNIKKLTEYTNFLHEETLSQDVNPDNKEKINLAITELEKKYDASYFIRTWRYYENSIDHSLTASSYAYALQWLNDLIDCHVTHQSENNSKANWIKYREQLKQLRENCHASLPRGINNKENVDQVIQIQKRFSKAIREEFLTEIFIDCEKVIAKPFFKYTVLAFGSLGRDELLLFSDFEFLILIESEVTKAEWPQVIAFFRALIELLRFKIQSLGESGIGCEPKGFLVDIGISPDYVSGEFFGAIGKPEKIVQFYMPNHFNEVNETRKIATAEFYSILHTAYIYGDVKLYEDLQTLIKEKLNTVVSPDLKLHQLVSYEHLPFDFNNVKKKIGLFTNRTDLLALKEAYLALFVYAAFDFAYFFNLSIANTKDKIFHTADVVQVLCDAQIIDQVTADFMLRSIAVIMAERFRAHHLSKQQLKPELVAPSLAAQKKALDWQPPTNYFEYNLEPVSIHEQLKSVYLNPETHHVYTLSETAFSQLVGAHWLFIKPLLLAFERLGVGFLPSLKRYNVLEDYFVELLIQAIEINSPYVLDDFINSLPDYFNYTNSELPFSANQVLAKINLEKLSSSDQLLILNVLGNYFSIEKTNIELPFSHRAINSLLHQAIRHQYMGAMNLLLRAGASVNAKDSEKQTALHVFAKNIIFYSVTDIPIVCQLLLADCNTINEYDNAGKTALHWLVTSFSVSPEQTKICLMEFVQNGANINAVDFILQESALDKAMQWQNAELFKILVELGASKLKQVDHALQFIENQIGATDQAKILMLLQQTNSVLVWRAALNALTLSQAEKDARKIQGVESGVRYLPKLDSYTPEYGRHNVTIYHNNKHQKICYKLNPELPGIEFAVRILAQLFFGHGVPYSELFRINDAKGKPIPVLISQYIDGENLQNILNKPNANEKLKQLDPKNFSDMLLLSMMILLEDGIPSNYKIVPFIKNNGQKSYQIVCVDNDHGFSKARKLNQKGNYELQAVCILWFFDQMQESIDPEARDEFLKKNLLEILSSWLDTLEHAEKNYFELFKTKDRDHLLFKQKKNNEASINIPIRKHLPELYVRLIRMRRALLKNPDITLLDLLAIVVPELGDLPKQAFNSAKTPLERLNILKQLVQINLGQTQSGVLHTLASASDILAMQEISLKESIAEKNQYSPALAKKDLNQLANEIDQLVAIKEEILQGKTDRFEQLLNVELKAKILKSIDFTSLEGTQNALIKIMKRGGFYKLTIKGASTLTDKDLSDILKASPGLTSLHLENCQRLTDVTIKNIQLYGQMIKKLFLLELPGIQISEKNPADHQFNSSKSELILKKLLIPNLTGIEELTISHYEGDLLIQSPTLLKFKLLNSDLLELELQTPQLTELSFERCEISVKADLSKLYLLEKFEIKYCDKEIKMFIPQFSSLKYFTFYESYRHSTYEPKTDILVEKFYPVLSQIFPDTLNLDYFFVSPSKNDLSPRLRTLDQFLMDFPFLLSVDLSQYIEIFEHKSLVKSIKQFLLDSMQHYAARNYNQSQIRSAIQKILPEYLKKYQSLLKIMNLTPALNYQSFAKLPNYSATNQYTELNRHKKNPLFLAMQQFITMPINANSQIETEKFVATVFAEEKTTLEINLLSKSIAAKLLPLCTNDSVIPQEAVKNNKDEEDVIPQELSDACAVLKNFDRIDSKTLEVLKFYAKKLPKSVDPKEIASDLFDIFLTKAKLSITRPLLQTFQYEDIADILLQYDLCASKNNIIDLISLIYLKEQVDLFIDGAQKILEAYSDRYPEEILPFVLSILLRRYSNINPNKNYLILKILCESFNKNLIKDYGSAEIWSLDVQRIFNKCAPYFSRELLDGLYALIYENPFDMELIKFGVILILHAPQSERFVEPDSNFVRLTKNLANDDFIITSLCNDAEYGVDDAWKLLFLYVAKTQEPSEKAINMLKKLIPLNMMSSSLVLCEWAEKNNIDITKIKHAIYNASRPLNSELLNFMYRNSSGGYPEHHNVKTKEILKFPYSATYLLKIKEAFKTVLQCDSDDEFAKHLTMLSEGKRDYQQITAAILKSDEIIPELKLPFLIMQFYFLKQNSFENYLPHFKELTRQILFHYEPNQLLKQMLDKEMIAMTPTQLLKQEPDPVQLEKRQLRS